MRRIEIAINLPTEHMPETGMPVIIIQEFPPQYKRAEEGYFDGKDWRNDHNQLIPTERVKEWYYKLDPLMP